MLRVVAQTLSKGCAMDIKARIQRTQVAVQNAAARRLLRETQRNLSAVNTFSSMIMPRLSEGEPERDMAKVISVQVCYVLSAYG